MIENYEKVLTASAALLTHLSQAFECMAQDLLIDCGVKEESLNLFSYLKSGKLRIRGNKTFTEWMHILFGRPQGSKFDIFEAKYADNNNPYCTGLSI